MQGRRLIAICVAVAMLAANPAAAAAPFFKAGDPVAGHRGMTYLDLVKLAVPSLAPSAGDDAIYGRLKAMPRHLGGREYDGDGMPDPVTLGEIEAQRIKIGGKRRIAVLADLGEVPGRVEGLALLMLITDEARPRLLDAANVGVDKDTVFAERGPLALGPGDDALVTYSEHDDADLSMGGYVLIQTAGDRLRLIQIIPVTSVRMCSWENIEDAHFAATPDPGRPYSKITVSVRAAFKRTHEDGCSDTPPKTHAQTFSASFDWNPAHRRFETASGELKRLDAFNTFAFK